MVIFIIRSSNFALSINIATKVKRFLGNHGLINIYFFSLSTHTLFWLLRGNDYENPLLQLVRLQSKAIGIVNDAPLSLGAMQ